ncbi:MAG: SRPBCC family protein [Candidatus Ranarchaeia archaeon]
MMLSKSKIIKSPVHKVWKVISDIELVAKLTPACTKTEPLSEQRKGVGTTTRWYSIVHPDNPSVEEIVDWQPLEYYAWRSYDGDTPVVDGVLSVNPTPEGYTILTLTEDFLITDVDLLKNEQEMERELEAIADYFKKNK